MIEKKPKGNILWTGGGDSSVDGGDGGERDEILEEIKVSGGMFVISFGGGFAVFVSLSYATLAIMSNLFFPVSLPCFCFYTASYGGGGAVRKLHL